MGNRQKLSLEISLATKLITMKAVIISFAVFALMIFSQTNGAFVEQGLRGGDCSDCKMGFVCCPSADGSSRVCCAETFGFHCCQNSAGRPYCSNPFFGSGCN